ncbi:MAG: beta-ketoacyl synthase N-terminal-like domain-containing protein, partial [Phycisphaerae bacterium]
MSSTNFTHTIKLRVSLAHLPLSIVINIHTARLGSSAHRRRAFDAHASGTVFTQGVGVVVLKPLKAALDEGDEIHAVIKAAAINNDGGKKVGFTAPSIEGQAQVIRNALEQH